METTILSLNIGEPEQMEWLGKSVRSSMHKRPVKGPLVVHDDFIEGDSFANPNSHGTIDSVIYAFGLPSLNAYMKLLGRETYEPGSVGENITCAELDETQISVGDVF